MKEEQNMYFFDIGELKESVNKAIESNNKQKKIELLRYIETSRLLNGPDRVSLHDKLVKSMEC